MEALRIISQESGHPAESPEFFGTNLATWKVCLQRRTVLTGKISLQKGKDLHRIAIVRATP